MSEIAGKNFVEYRYTKAPRSNGESQRGFFKRMQTIHRSFRDPTEDPPHPENMKDFSQLYIFPYPSTVLKNMNDEWEIVVPNPVMEDINKFFQKLHESGKDTLFLQCADGIHLELRLSKIIQKT